MYIYDSHATFLSAIFKVFILPWLPAFLSSIQFTGNVFWYPEGTDLWKAGRPQRTSEKQGVPN